MDTVGKNFDAENDDISNVERDFQKYAGISIRETSGEFKDFSIVISQLSEKWNTLSEVSQSAVAKALAGTRQRENFLILMNNMDKALELQTSQLDSNGSAMVRYGEKTKSTEARLNDLTNAFQKLWMQLISSEFINSSIDGFTKLINTIGNVTSTFGGLNTAIYTVIATLAIFKAQAIGGVVTSVGRWVIAFGLAETASLGLSMGIKSLSTALLGLAKNPLTWVVMAVGVATTALVSYGNKQAEIKKQLEETGKAQEDFNKTLKDFENSSDPKKITEVANSLEKIKQAVNYDETSAKIKKLQDDIKSLENQKQIEPAMDISGSVAKKQAEIEKLTASLKPYTDAQNKYNEAQRIATILDYESVQADNKKIALKIQENEINRQLINSYQKVHDKLVQGNKLTEEEASLNQKMIEKYPEYTKVLNDKTDAVGIDIKALKANQTAEEALAIVSFNAMKSKAEQSKIETQQIVKDTEARIRAIDAEIQALTGLDQARGANLQLEKLKSLDSAQLLAEMKNGTIFEDNITPKLKVDLSSAYKQLNSAKQTLTAWNTLANMSIDDLRKGVNSNGSEKSYNPPNGSGGSKSSSSSSKQQEEPVTGPYGDTIRKVAQQYGISATLLDALIKHESGFKASVVSTAGAIGLTQLMPSTASSLGVTNPYDPVQNISGGAKYLKQQLDKFGGDISLALAAYNAGPGAVQKYGGIPPYSETQNYVKSVLADYNSRKLDSATINDISNFQTEKPAYTDPTDAILTQIQAQSNLTKTKADATKETIEQAKAEKDYQTALQKSSELVGTVNGSKQLSDLISNRNEINKEKDTMLASTPFGDITRWYDNNNNTSDAYTKEFSNASAEVQTAMQSEFDKMQKLRNDWLTNKNSMGNIFISPEEKKDLDSALAQINKAKDEALNNSQFGDITRWFNDANNASQQYLTEFQNANADVQQQMTQEFNNMQSLRKEWVDNRSIADHLSISAQQMQDLDTARDKINKLKDALLSSASSRFGDINRWFDNTNEASLAFINEKNATDAQTQKEMDTLFTTLQKLRKAWVENSNAVKELNKEINSLNVQSVQLEIDRFNDSISTLDSKLSLSKTTMELYDESSQEYQQEHTKQISLLKEKETAINNEIIALQKQAEATILTAEAQKLLSDELAKLQLDLAQTKKDIYDYNAQMADDTINILKDYYNQRKDLAIKSIEKQIEAEEKRHQTVTDNLDAELTQFEDMINSQIKALDDQANAEDYAKSLTEAQKEAQDIQNQINILSLDDSIEAKAQKEELAKSLADKISKIEDMQTKHNRDLQKENLQNQLNAYKKDIDEKKKAEDAKYKTNKDRLEQERKDQEYYWNEQINDERKYAKIRKDIVNGNVDDMKNKLSTFLSEFKNMNEETCESLGISWTSLQSLIGNIIDLQNELGNLPTQPQQNIPPQQNYTGGKIKVYGNATDIANARAAATAVGESNRFDFVTVSNGNASGAEAGSIVLGGTAVISNTGQGSRVAGYTEQDTLNKFKSTVGLGSGNGNSSSHTSSGSSNSSGNSSSSSSSSSGGTYYGGTTVGGQPVDDGGSSYKKWVAAGKPKLKNGSYDEGGETQLTGLHWLDGKLGKPERVLSAEQTESFNKLVDILPKINIIDSIKNSFNIPKFIPKLTGGNNITISPTIQFNGSGNLTTRDLDKISDYIANKTQIGLRKLGLVT